MDTESVKSVSTHVILHYIDPLKATAIPAANRTAARFEEEKKAPVIDLPRPNPANEEALRTHKRLMAEYERQRKAKSITIPTNDAEVKMGLRQFKQPICLFGEDAISRRERLKEIVQKTFIEEGRVPLLGKPKEQKEEKATEDRELFYTHGSEELKAARMEIALFSIPKATIR